MQHNLALLQRPLHLAMRKAADHVVKSLESANQQAEPGRIAVPGAVWSGKLARTFDPAFPHGSATSRSVLGRTHQQQGAMRMPNVAVCRPVHSHLRCCAHEASRGVHRFRS